MEKCEYKPLDSSKSQQQQNCELEMGQTDNNLSKGSLNNNISQPNPQVIDQKNIPLSQQLSKWQLFKLDFSSIVLLNVLYFYQGLLLSFFHAYLKTYLIQEKNISGEEIALLQGISWPYSFKFLWAPIMDTYYSNKLGRRKTYLVPAQFGIAMVFFFSSFYFESWMDTAQVGFIAGIGTTSIFLITIQDVAVDSWSVSLLHEENLAYASFSQFFGQTIGNLFGYQLFIYLTDEKLMNDLFQIKGKAVSPMTMCLMISGAILIGTLYILIFCKEKNEEQLVNDDSKALPSTTINEANQKQQFPLSLQQEPEEVVIIDHTFKGMLKNIKSFFRNTHVLTLILFLLTVTFGNHCIGIPADILLLNKGFSRSTLATIELCLLPLTQIASGLAARLAQEKKEFQIWYICFICKFFTNIWSYFVAENYTEQEAVLYTVQISILGVIETIVGTMPFIALSAFFLRICDKSIGGTYLTFLNSFTNLGNLWCSLLISVLSRHFSLTTFILISCIYNITILIAWRKKVFELQESPKEQWHIKH